MSRGPGTPHAPVRRAPAASLGVPGAIFSLAIVAAACGEAPPPAAAAPFRVGATIDVGAAPRAGRPGTRHSTSSASKAAGS